VISTYPQHWQLDTGVSGRATFVTTKSAAEAMTYAYRHGLPFPVVGMPFPTILITRIGVSYTRDVVDVTTFGDAKAQYMTVELEITVDISFTDYT
jgi:hypothetical protein